MRYDPHHHRRRSIRLPGHDYTSAGSYFITICAQGHECLFGEVIGGETQLNAHGEIVREEWERSAAIRGELQIDAYVVMPNHLHGIVSLTEERSVVGAHGHAPLRNSVLHRPPRTIGAFVGRFKGAVTRRINAAGRTEGTSIWQRNYYEHVVRDEDDLDRIRAYIEDNPRRWTEDQYHPSRGYGGPPGPRLTIAAPFAI